MGLKFGVEVKYGVEEGTVEVKYGVDEGTEGPIFHAKFNPIGATCRPCGRKTSKSASG